MYKETVYLRRVDGRWSVVNISDKSELISNGEIEAIDFYPHSSLFKIAFTNTCAVDKGDTSENQCTCVGGVLGLLPRSKSGYTLCESSFKTPSKSSGAIALSILQSGLAALYGSTSIINETDTDAVSQALTEADVLGKLNSKYYGIYLSDFSKMDSIDAASNFILKYKGKYDPDELVAKAEAIGVELRESAVKKSRLLAYREAFAKSISSSDYKKFIEKYQNDDPEGFIPQARKNMKIAEADEVIKRKEESVRQEAQRKEEAAKQAKLEAWRKNIREGDETNCGPVLEVKKTMVKIYFPVQNYGNEHWIRTDKIKPPLEGCRFVNGQYLAD